MANSEAPLIQVVHGKLSEMRKIRYSEKKIRQQAMLCALRCSSRYL